MSKRPASQLDTTHFLYVHGWGVGPEGAKCRLMRQHLPDQQVHAFSWHVPTYAETTTTRALAELVSRMKAVGPGTWNVVGSSQGGYLAALLAQQYPELVNRLLLLCPSFDSFAGWVGDMQKTHTEWVPGTQCEPPPPLGPYNNTGDGSGGIGFAFVEDLRCHPPYPTVRCPAVVVHGLDDEEARRHRPFASPTRTRRSPAHLALPSSAGRCGRLDGVGAPARSAGAARCSACLANAGRDSEDRPRPLPLRQARGNHLSDVSAAAAGL